MTSVGLCATEQTSWGKLSRQIFVKLWQNVDPHNPHAFHQTWSIRVRTNIKQDSERGFKLQDTSLPRHTSVSRQAVIFSLVLYMVKTLNFLGCAL